MRTVQLSDMDYGMIVGVLIEQKKRALNLVSSINRAEAAGFPGPDGADLRAEKLAERDRARSRAQEMHELVEALRKA